MDLSESITYHITKTGNVLRQLTARRIRDAGIDLTPEESVLMNQLWESDNRNISELNLWSVKEPSTMTRQIDHLVSKGYVTRSHGVEDRRTVYVKLTAQGRKLKKTFEKTRVSCLDSDLIDISPRDAEKLLALLIATRVKAQEELHGSR